VLTTIGVDIETAHERSPQNPSPLKSYWKR